MLLSGGGAQPWDGISQKLLCLKMKIVKTVRASSVGVEVGV